MRTTVTLPEYIRRKGMPEYGVAITVVREDNGEPLKRAFHHYENGKCHYVNPTDNWKNIFSVDEQWVELTITEPTKDPAIELLKEIDAWLSFNTHPSQEEIKKMRKSIQTLLEKQ